MNLMRPLRTAMVLERSFQFSMVHQVAPWRERRRRKNGRRPRKISKRDQVLGRLYASEVGVKPDQTHLRDACILQTVFDPPTSFWRNMLLFFSEIHNKHFLFFNPKICTFFFWLEMTLLWVTLKIRLILGVQVFLRWCQNYIHLWWSWDNTNQMWVQSYTYQRWNRITQRQTWVKDEHNLWFWSYSPSWSWSYRNIFKTGACDLACTAVPGFSPVLDSSQAPLQGRGRKNFWEDITNMGNGDPGPIDHF